MAIFKPLTEPERLRTADRQWESPDVMTKEKESDNASSTSIPTNHDWLVKGFLGYARRMMRRQFHVFAVVDEIIKHLQLAPTTPLIVYSNHPGWWDPIVGGLLRAEYFPDRKLFAPIDQQALENYRVLAKMGFYGIDLATMHGAAHFLRVSRAILQTQQSSLWLTPEGRFSDVRDHSLALMPGLAHLVSQTPNVVAIPLAIEYPFWEERLPEALAMFGEPLVQDPQVNSNPQSKKEWHQRLTNNLRETQNQLASLSINRSTEKFRILLTSRGKVLSVYDRMRSLAARIRGKAFRVEHSSKFQPPSKPS